MVQENVQRRLAAIVAADVVGYSRLMEADEAGTLAVLKMRRKEVLQPLVSRHQGRIFKIAGDSALIEFVSAVEAVACAFELQNAMTAANIGLPKDRQITLRIGINLGDVMVEGSDLYGDGVNIAARIEALADPGSVFVSRTVFNHVRGKMNFGFDDLGEQQLKNIGEPVRIFRLRPDGESAEPFVVFPDKPSIAVLPFQNLSGDPEQEFFADGLTEDIIAALSRISGLWVIARTSTSMYKGKPADVKQVGRELGVRYVMEGSVRRSGERVRVTAQLVDATTGHHVWAERYDRALADLFEIQDDITRSVASTTETQVYLAERGAPALSPSPQFRARDLVDRALRRMHDQTPEAFAEVSELVEEALRLDSSIPRAHLLRAFLFIQRMYFGITPYSDENVARGLELARTALRLAPGDELAHLVMSEAYGVARQLEDAVAECERGLEINPNNSDLLGNLGAYLAGLGKSQEAIDACSLALRLNPRSPGNFWRHINIAIAHFTAANYAAALQESKNVARSRAHPLSSGIIWAASAAAVGQVDEARRAVQHCLAQRPDLRIEHALTVYLRFERDDDRARLMSFLRAAGLPE